MKDLTHIIRENNGTYEKPPDQCEDCGITLVEEEMEKGDKLCEICRVEREND